MGKTYKKHCQVPVGRIKHDIHYIPEEYRGAITNTGQQEHLIALELKIRKGAARNQISHHNAIIKYWPTSNYTQKEIKRTIKSLKNIKKHMEVMAYRAKYTKHLLHGSREK